VTSGQVAGLFGVSRSRVYQFDAELRPERCACGARVYSAAVVEAFAARRAAQLAELSKARADRMRTIREVYQPRRRRTPWR
jgi:hypothetical protein